MPRTRRVEVHRRGKADGHLPGDAGDEKLVAMRKRHRGCPSNSVDFDPIYRLSHIVRYPCSVL